MEKEGTNFNDIYLMISEGTEDKQWVMRFLFIL